MFAPSYFTDRNASAEIVQWFDEKESPLAQYKFADEIQRAIARRGHLVFIGLVATPRQIAEAALTVWGIREGEAK